ncbi:hypothetical protein L596_008665 [Steinernema carpocapsae]|uniref:Uncharacterized protein n=1 Tax=Steinernema carpocapsae TaxID=34508 RepID=A0A4U5PDH1_STECR|nr:hypothetical protein L596_008665 [Steinernema carpocapsae]
MGSALGFVLLVMSAVFFQTSAWHLIPCTSGTKLNVCAFYDAKCMFRKIHSTTIIDKKIHVKQYCLTEPIPDFQGLTCKNRSDCFDLPCMNGRCTLNKKFNPFRVEGKVCLTSQDCATSPTSNAFIFPCSSCCQPNNEKDGRPTAAGCLLIE